MHTTDRQVLLCLFLAGNFKTCNAYFGLLFFTVPMTGRMSRDFENCCTLSCVVCFMYWQNKDLAGKFVWMCVLHCTLLRWPIFVDPTVSCMSRSFHQFFFLSKLLIICKLCIQAHICHTKRQHGVSLLSKVKSTCIRLSLTCCFPLTFFLL